ncbi:MAG TPA: CBS domain-containing protein [Propionibacteriaceae bacterium]|nr:CBS domain-containing protein [Propionibacteriaceae bacterium]
MIVSDVIRVKGDQVVTISSDATVGQLVALLAEKGIGAVVVSDDGQSVTGIVSERDVVLHLGSEGGAVLDGPVSGIMTTDVHTCSLGDDIEALAAQMTEHRVRHLPVVVNGHLHSIISIGDVVKSHISQLRDERDHLVGYLHQ